MLQACSARVTPEVTVVIPSHWSEQTVEACLAAVVAQQTERRFEVVVLHSGDQPLPEGIEARHGEVSFQRLAGDIWPAAKRNAGARSARSPWVLYLDVDCVPEPSWLDALVEAASRSGAAVAGGSVDIGQPFDGMAWTMHLLEFGEWLPGSSRRWCKDVPTCNALYRRDVLLDSGGFPEDLFPCEDTVANARIRRLGHRVLFEPRATVAHHHAGTRERYLAKNRQFGAMYSLAAARYDLPGRSLRHPLLAPAVSAGRWCSMAGRALRYRPRPEWKRLAVDAPFALRCLKEWSAAFTRPGTSRYGIARDTVPAGREAG